MCGASEVEIKTDEVYSLKKQRGNFILCLLVNFWRFLHFRSEHRVEFSLATSIQIAKRSRFGSPATSFEFDMLHVNHFIDSIFFMFCVDSIFVRLCVPMSGASLLAKWSCEGFREKRSVE